MWTSMTMLFAHPWGVWAAPSVGVAWASAGCGRSGSCGGGHGWVGGSARGGLCTNLSSSPSLWCCPLRNQIFDLHPPLRR